MILAQTRATTTLQARLETGRFWHEAGEEVIASSTFGRVQEIAAESFGLRKEEIKAETPVRSLGDSLEIASFLVDLETEFGLRMPQEEMQKIRDLQGIVNYLESHG